MRLLGVLLASAAVAGVSAADKCYSKPEWRSEDGQLWFHDEVFRLKGVNWFGFENANHVLDGLWGNGSMARYLDFLVENDFNAIRVPVSLSMVHNKPLVVEDACGTTDCPRGKTWDIKAFDVLTRLFELTADRGILIMLDMHSLEPAGYHDETRWYSKEWTEEQFFDGWSELVGMYVGYPNLFACDLRNEPHSSPYVEPEKSSSWGWGNEATDWNTAAEKAILRIMKDNPSYAGFFFVEGVSDFTSPTPYDDAVRWITSWWGGNLWGVYEHPLNPKGYRDRVVYAPHIYGPGTWAHWYFEGMADFPRDMEWVWDTTAGFVEGLTGNAVALGEWGAVSTPMPLDKRSPDSNLNLISDSLEWQEALADYLWANCLSDTFYWCLNSNSADTGGLLTDDWRTPDPRKLAVTQSVQPYPSKFSTIESGNLCFSSGKDANADMCRSYSWETRETVKGPKSTRSRANYYKDHKITAHVMVSIELTNSLLGDPSQIFLGTNSVPGVIASVAKQLDIDVDRFILAQCGIAPDISLQQARSGTTGLGWSNPAQLSTSQGAIEALGTTKIKLHIADYGDDVITALINADFEAVAAGVLADIQDPDWVAKYEGLFIYDTSDTATFSVLLVEDTTETPATIDAGEELVDEACQGYSGFSSGSDGSPEIWSVGTEAQYSIKSGIALAGLGGLVFSALMLSHRKRPAAKVPAHTMRRAAGPVQAAAGPRRSPGVVL